MRHELRLRRASDIARVRATGGSWVHPLLVWVMTPRNDQAPSRFAVVTGKRVGKAVARNRVKRRLREAVRGLSANLQPGYDVVLIARAPAAPATYASLESAVASLASRSGIRPKSGSEPTSAHADSATSKHGKPDSPP